jgi:replication factor C subunit 2/4
MTFLHIVFVQVCDQPHPLLLKELINKAIEGNILESHALLNSLWREGYAAADIISTLYKVVKNFEMEEFLKLEFIKVKETNHQQF